MIQPAYRARLRKAENTLLWHILIQRKHVEFKTALQAQRRLLKEHDVALSTTFDIVFAEEYVFATRSCVTPILLDITDADIDEAWVRVTREVALE